MTAWGGRPSTRLHHATQLVLHVRVAVFAAQVHFDATDALAEILEGVGHDGLDFLASIFMAGERRVGVDLNDHRVSWVMQRIDASD